MAWLAAPLTAPRRPLLVRGRPPAWRHGSLAAQKQRRCAVHLRAGVPSSDGGHSEPVGNPATPGEGLKSKVPSPASSVEDRAGTSSLPRPVTSTVGDQQQETVQQDQPYHQQQQQPPSITKQPASAAAAGVTWRSLLASAVGKLLTNLWPLLLVHLVSDGLTFGLHRVSHRLTNEAAVRLLAGIGITPAAIGNMWWLSSDPALANFRTGYQFLTIAVFLLAFPLNVLLKATASIYTVFICEGDVGKEVQRPWWQAPGALRAALPLVRGLSGRVGAVWRRALLVELLVAIIVVPLQFTSLAVVTLPFTLPFLLDLQAAGTAAVLEGVGGIAAIKRSRQLIKPIRWKLAVPFVGIVVAQHVMNSAKGFLLGNLPPRYYLELVEIPAAIAVLGTLATLLLTRLQDVLPYTAYTAAAALEGAQGPGGGGTRELPAAEQQPQPKPV